MCAGSERHARTQHAADDKLREMYGDRLKPETRMPSDGRKTFIRQLSAAEVEQHKKGG